MNEFRGAKIFLQLNETTDKETAERIVEAFNNDKAIVLPENAKLLVIDVDGRVTKL